MATGIAQTLKGVKINFNLRNPKDKLTPVNCIIRYNNNRIVISNVGKVEPKFWNDDTQQVKNEARNLRGVELNYDLRDLKTGIENTFNQFIKKHKYYPDPADFKLECIKLINKEFEKEPDKITDLIVFGELIISESKSGKRLNIDNSKPISPATVRSYQSVVNALKGFKSAKNYDLNFENLTLEFYEDYTEYLKFDKNFTSNSEGKHVKTVKTFLNEAKDRGLIKNEYFKSKRFKVLREDVDNIYLNEAELSKLLALDLSEKPRLDRVRDLFIVGCYTGLRFSDYNAIGPKNFVNNNFKIKTIKTGREVAIPIHPAVYQVMAKYQGITENSLPPSLSNAKMNEYIKEVCKEAKLNEIITTEFTKAGKKVLKNSEKYKLVSTHTARRSFATNNFLLGVPTLTIMSITGHKTESSFMKYIKVTPDEHAENMRKIWERQPVKLQAV